MSDVFFEVGDKDLSWSRRPVLTDVVFQPNSYRMSTLGGPVESSITAYGTREALYDLIELLRCPVKMYDWYAQNLFWGFINEVQVRSEALEIAVTLDGMANKVCLEYSSMTPGEVVVGDQVLTDWTSDAVSISSYGTKELIASLPDIPSALAAAKRDLLLAQKKYPTTTWYMSGEQGSLSATLLCKGWWSTLDWMYYQNNSGYEAYTTSGEGVQPFGDLSWRASAGQSFQLGVATGWYADQILVKVRKQGSPSDNITVELKSDNAGSPGTQLAFGTITAASAPTDYNWVIVSLNTRVWVAPATTYWVTLSRSGAIDATNYFVVDVNQELGYTRGVLRLYDGGSWNARVPDADMNFQVQGVIQTTDQLAAMEAACGQFLTGIKLDLPSGVYSCPYRPGTSSALEEALELLKAGTSNNRRMLAEVTVERVLRIYEEPAKPSAPDLLMVPSGRVKTLIGQLWPPFWNPVGKWVGMKDVVPTNLDSTLITDPYMVFIDEYAYSFQDKVGTIYPRTEPSPWDVGVVPTDDKP